MPQPHHAAVAEAGRQLGVRAERHPKHAAKGAKGDGVGGNGCANARPGGGLGTKIHLAADRRCRPVSRILSRAALAGELR
jgi:hypothetical protein